MKKNRVFAAMLMVALLAGAVSADIVPVNGVPTEVSPALAPPVSAPATEAPAVTNELDEEFINFDELDAPPYFSAAEPLTNEYEDLGVIFIGAGEVLHEDGNFGISGYSSPNFLAFNTGASVPGPETMEFDPPVSMVSFFAGHSSSGFISLEAYDADGFIVADDGMNGSSTLAEMMVAADEIYSVTVSFTGTVMCIDDITFEPDTTPDPVEFDLMVTQDVIPPSGGDVIYDVSLVSNIGATYAGVNFWTHVILPNGQEFGPLVTIPFTLTPFMQVFQTGLVQSVPALAPTGEYTFVGRVGYMAGPYLEDSFLFTKTGTAADGVTGWHGSAPVLAGELQETVAAPPSDFVLSRPYPNPFNPTSSLSVTLPEAAELTVTLHNVTGRQVAELAAGTFSAGTHSLVVDGSGLASGVYFVRATIPGESVQSAKLMLMK